MAFLVNAVLPCLLYEDEHLLVVNKPAGLNTHAPAPYAGEGLYDWLRHREPRWASLAIVHRLDKETSGLIVFAKTPLANRSLTAQFAGAATPGRHLPAGHFANRVAPGDPAPRRVRKKYILLTDCPVPSAGFTVVSDLVRCGEKYVSRPAAAIPRVGKRAGQARSQPSWDPTARAISDPFKSSAGNRAITRFCRLSRARSLEILDAVASAGGPSTGGVPFAEPAVHRAAVSVWEAWPLTGRTHQIRVQAAERGLPILGDALYGGTPAKRLFLHAAELAFQHPATGAPMRFEVPPSFTGPARLDLRAALLDPSITTAYRVVHGAADGWPGWYLDRWGDFLLAQSERPPTPAEHDVLADWQAKLGLRGVYHKTLSRHLRSQRAEESAPQWVRGEAAPPEWEVRENGLSFAVRFDQGYSTGLFLDQRDNRRRLLVNHVAAGFPLWPAGQSSRSVLNTFAYTCGFSVCAAQAGAQVTSLDLSAKYLEWGRRNFALSGLSVEAHEFIQGDVFDWLKRWRKKGRLFDVILLDPPTFSTSKQSGSFRAEHDYGCLVAQALPLLRPGGILFASTNAAKLGPEQFLATLRSAVQSAGRHIAQSQYVPQPPDFPIHRDEPAHLKTVWLRVDGKND